jgi:uncharacterized membrane protein YraQ (UPF0718 family)
MHPNTLNMLGNFSERALGMTVYDLPRPLLRRHGFWQLVPVMLLLAFLISQLMSIAVDQLGSVLDHWDLAIMSMVCTCLVALLAAALYTLLVNQSVLANFKPVPGRILGYGLVFTSSKDVLAGNFNCNIAPHVEAARHNLPYRDSLQVQLLIVPARSRKRRVIQISWEHMLYIVDHGVNYYNPTLIENEVRGQCACHQ